MIGHITCLWHKVIELREDGDISQWTEEDIAYYSKWEGDVKKYYETLKNRFIDEKNDFKLIHDWLDYAYKYLYSKYHQNNPKVLKLIKKKHNYKGYPKGYPKGSPLLHLPNQPTVPNQPNLTLISQIDNLLRSFPISTQEKIKIFWHRASTKNKSKVVSDGRRLTLLTELYNSFQRCNNQVVFDYALEAANSYDAPSIGYVNAVIKNRLVKK
jgi:hypothetical protein